MDTMKPTEIRTHEPFVNLFPIKTEVLGKIEEHIRENRFLISHPLDLATWDGQKEPVCVDGHTRLQAAINLGLERVPVITHELDTEDEALELAIHLQRNRRNMTDKDILACVEALDRRKPRGGDRRSEEAKSKASSDAIETSPSKSATETGNLLGVSTTKVERARAVLGHADSETLEAVEQGEMSLNKAHGEIQKKRRSKKALRNDSQAQDVGENVEPKKGPEESSIGKSKNATAGNTSVTLDANQYQALEALGGSVSDHVKVAVEQYLDSLEKDSKPAEGSEGID